MNIEEDGDEVFGVPDKCVLASCSGDIEAVDRGLGPQWTCLVCGAGYGVVDGLPPDFYPNDHDPDNGDVSIWGYDGDSL